MEEKKRGGKRLGAGRKSAQSKKKQISIYVEGSKILKFGSEEKMKEAIYEFINKFGDKNIVDSNQLTGNYEAPKINHNSPAMWLEQKPKIDQYAAYQTEISEANSVGEIKNILQEIKKETIPDWQKRKLEQFAIDKSKTFDF
jgi:hypothetical protein